MGLDLCQNPTLKRNREIRRRGNTSLLNLPLICDRFAKIANKRVCFSTQVIQGLVKGEAVNLPNTWEDRPAHR